MIFCFIYFVESSKTDTETTTEPEISLDNPDIGLFQIAVSAAKGAWKYARSYFGSGKPNEITDRDNSFVGNKSTKRKMKEKM